MSETNVDKFNRNNIIIWLAILLGMIVLVVVSYVLSLSQSLSLIQDSKEVKNVLFLLAIILAVGILFLKRSFFAAKIIVAKIRSSAKKNHEQLLLARLRKNYIIVWVLGEMILLLGFIEFVLIADFNSFLIYAVVGLYAVLINFPRKTLITKSLEILFQSQA